MASVQTLGPGTLTIILVAFIVIGTAFEPARPVVFLLLVFILIGLLLRGEPQIHSILSGLGA